MWWWWRGGSWGRVEVELGMMGFLRGVKSPLLFFWAKLQLTNYIFSFFNELHSGDYREVKIGVKERKGAVVRLFYYLRLIL